MSAVDSEICRSAVWGDSIITLKCPLSIKKHVDVLAATSV